MNKKLKDKISKDRFWKYEGNFNNIWISIKSIGENTVTVAWIETDISTKTTELNTELIVSEESIEQIMDGMVKSSYEEFNKAILELTQRLEELKHKSTDLEFINQLKLES